MYQLCSLAWLLQPRDGLHLRLVHLQIVGVLQHLELLLPVDGINLLVSHLAQIALHVDGNPSLAGKISHYLGREIIAQQASQVIDFRLHVLQLSDGERISLGKHTLLALVLVFSVDILEEDGIARWVEGYFYARLAHLFYRLCFCWIHCRDERKAHILGQLVDGIGEVERCSASHVNSSVWGNYLVFGYVPYTTNIFHLFLF